ncbi:hypothetical protein MMC31_004071 [Peltigera leucophlebia]|nr:hypothetical protein [Peltigera leucophlebia]
MAVFPCFGLPEREMIPGFTARIRLGDTPAVIAGTPALIERHWFFLNMLRTIYIERARLRRFTHISYFLTQSSHSKRALEMVTCDSNKLEEVDFLEDYHRLSPDQHFHLEPFVYPYAEHSGLYFQLKPPQPLPHSAPGLPQPQTQTVLSENFVVDHDVEFIPEAEFEPKAHGVAHFQVD